MLGLEQQKKLLLESKTIAVVGLSPKVQRPSYQVAAAMQQYGYRIIPMRPAVDEILSEQAGIQVVIDKCILKQFQQLIA